MHRNLFLLTCVAISEYFSLAIVLSTLAPYFLDHHSGLFFNHTVQQSTRLQLLGVALAAAPLGQWLSGGLLGEFSDRYGRKKLLIFSLVGTAFSAYWVAFSVQAHIFSGLLLGRFLTGLFAGNIAISQASIADMTNVQYKIRHFNYLQLGIGVGMLIGPILGSYLLKGQVLHFERAFYANFFLTVVMLFVICFFYQETLKKIPLATKKIFCWYQGPRLLWQACTAQNIRPLLLFWTIFILGWNFYLQYFTNFLRDALFLTQMQIGHVYAYMGIIYLVYQAVIIFPLSKKMATRKLPIILVCVFFVGFFLLCIGFSQKMIGVWVGLAGYMLTMSIFMPNFNGLLSDFASAEQQGSVFGMSVSIHAGTAVLISIIGGFVLLWSPRSPLVGGGSIILLSFLLLWSIASTLKNRHNQSNLVS